MNMITPGQTPISQSVFRDITRLNEEEYDDAIARGLARRSVIADPSLLSEPRSHNLFDLVEFAVYRAIGIHINDVSDQERIETAEKLALTLADAYPALMEVWKRPNAFEIVESTSASPIVLRLTKDLRMVGKVYAALNAVLRQLEDRLKGELPFSLMYWHVPGTRSSRLGVETIVVLVPGRLSTTNPDPEAAMYDNDEALSL